MNASFTGLLGGLIGAMVLVYLLMVVNFQSWLDPFIIIAVWPWALGKEASRNAPLGRAVIGGLIFATLATLLFVPTVFHLIHGRRRAPGVA